MVAKIQETSQEIVVFELTCPWDSNIARSHTFKSEKYAPLIADLSGSHLVHFFPSRLPREAR